MSVTNNIRDPLLVDMLPDEQQAGDLALGFIRTVQESIGPDAGLLIN